LWRTGRSRASAPPSNGLGVNCPPLLHAAPQPGWTYPMPDACTSLTTARSSTGQTDELLRGLRDSLP
jgi:hypothetical protein